MQGRGPGLLGSPFPRAICLPPLGRTARPDLRVRRSPSPRLVANRRGTAVPGVRDSTRGASLPLRVHVACWLPTTAEEATPPCLPPAKVVLAAAHRTMAAAKHRAARVQEARAADHAWSFLASGPTGCANSAPTWYPVVTHSATDVDTLRRTTCPPSAVQAAREAAHGRMDAPTRRLLSCRKRLTKHRSVLRKLNLLLRRLPLARRGTRPAATPTQARPSSRSQPQR